MIINAVEQSCCSCGCTFWITEKHDKILLQSKNSFYCPNGHTQSYTGKSDKQLLQEKKEELERYKKYYAGECDRNEKLKNQIKGFKGVIAKNKKGGSKK